MGAYEASTADYYYYHNGKGVSTTGRTISE